MFTNLPLYNLLYITLLLSYMVLSRYIPKLPKIPFGLFVGYFVLLFFAKIFKGYTWSIEWPDYLYIASDVLLSWGIARVVFWLMLEILIKLKGKDKAPPKITMDFILFVTFVVLFLLVLRIRSDINLASLLTTSAVITVMLGLAAQATLSNFFSGLIIQVERPFDIGDWIEFEGKEGRIVGISWKSTQLLTREQVLIYIPNSILAASTFSNFSKPTKQKIARIYIGLEYDAPYNKVKQVITEVTDQHPRILKRPPVIIRLIEFGDFAITYEIRVWHNSYAYEPQLQADIYQQLWYALRRNNIRIPFPIRDVQHHHIVQKQKEKQMVSLQTEIQGIMKQVPILATLSDANLEKLASMVEVEMFGAGELIVQEGEKGDSMYIIRSGSCDVMQKGADGRLMLLTTMIAGEFFGEISLLTGSKRTATIKTNEDTSLIFINKTVFSKIMRDDPIISEQIAQAVVERQERKGVDMDNLEEIGTKSKKFLAKVKLFLGL